MSETTGPTLPERWIKARRFVFPILNILSFIPAVIIVALGLAGKLKQNSTFSQYVSASDSALAVHPDAHLIAFSVIGVLLLVFLLFHLPFLFCIFKIISLKGVGVFGGDNFLLFQRIGFLFFPLNLLLIGWTCGFVYQQFWVTWSFALLLSLLLFAMYARVGVSYGATNRFVSDHNVLKVDVYAIVEAVFQPNSRKRLIYLWEYWVVQLPISALFAWSSYMSFYGFITAWKYQFIQSNPDLAHFGWNEQGTGAVVHCLLTLLGAGFAYTRDDFVFSSFISFALFGIGYYRKDSGSRQIIMTSSFVCAALLTAFTVFVALRCLKMVLTKKFSKKQDIMEL